MKNKVYNYIIYFLGFLTMLFFFLFSFVEDMYYPMIACLIITTVLYFLNSTQSKVESKFELICDVILFVGIFAIAIALISFTFMHMVLAIFVSLNIVWVLAYFVTTVLFIIGFGKRIGERKISNI